MTLFSVPASSAAPRCAEACPFTNTSPTACSPLSRTCSCASSSPSITPAIALSAAKSSPACRWGKIATISFSTTRCARNAFTSASASARFPAPPSISRKPPPSISAAAFNTASECSKPRFSSRSSAPASSTPPFSAKRERLSRPALRLTTSKGCRSSHRGVKKAPCSPLPRQEAQNLTGKLIRESKARLGPRIEIHGLLIQPDHAGLQRAVFRSRTIVCGMRFDASAGLDRVVIQGQAFARFALGAAQGVGESVERNFIGAEDQHFIEQRRYLHHAPVHLPVPKFERAAPLLVPAWIEIENQIYLPPPMLVIMMIAEVGMHVQEAASARLVQAAAFQHIVRHQVGNSS